MQETQVWLLRGQEDPLEKEMATHSSILAWRIPMDTGVWWARVYGVARVGRGWGTAPPPARSFLTSPAPSHLAVNRETNEVTHVVLQQDCALWSGSRCVVCECALGCEWAWHGDECAWPVLSVAQLTACHRPDVAGPAFLLECLGKGEKVWL